MDETRGVLKSFVMSVLSRIDKSVVFSVIMLLVCLGWIYITIDDSILLYQAIHRHARHIALQLGDYTVVGGCVILGSMMLFMLYIVFTGPEPGPVKPKSSRVKKRSESKREKIARWVLIVFVLVNMASMLVLPLVMNTRVGGYLEAHGYTYCDNLSSHGLVYRTKVYRRDSCHPVDTQNNLIN